MARFLVINGNQLAVHTVRNNKASAVSGWADNVAHPGTDVVYVAVL